MLKIEVEQAIIEAERFIKAAKKAIEMGNKVSNGWGDLPYHPYSCCGNLKGQYNAAAKRASLDLSQQLSVMRNNQGN